MEDVDAMMYKRIETMSQRERTRFRSWIIDYNIGIMEKTELTTKLTRLFKLEGNNLNAPKIDENPKEDYIRNDPKIRPGRKVRVREDDNMEEIKDFLRKIDLASNMEGPSEKKEKLVELFKAIEKRLSPSEKNTYISLCIKFKFHRITYSNFLKSLGLLIKKYRDLSQDFVEFVDGDKESQEDEDEETQDDEDTDIEEGKVQEDNLSGPKIRTGIKSPQERESLNVVDNKKKRNLLLRDSNQTERYERVITPSYRLIPEEEQRPVSSRVLNKTCMLRKVDTRGGKKLTNIEKEMANCEDQMFEADMLMETLRSAVERADKVMKGEMKFDDIGVMFYRCLEQLYGGDMFEIVSKDHKRALPVMLKRLNQKLLEVTAARESWKALWKQAIEENHAKQRDSIAQGHKKK